jgi:hypothetical protein
MVNRREFIATAAAATAAVLTPGRLLAALEKQTAPLPDLSQWSTVRAQFALAKDHLHFASFYIVSHPKPVRDAIEDFRRVLDANPFLTVEHRMFEEADNIQYKIRDDLSGYLGAKREEIAITGNTTTGLALVYNGLLLSAGDEILTTTHDHYSHHESIRFAAARTGATVRKVPLFEKSATATTAEMTEKLRAAIKPNTRVVGLTWVHSSTGMRLPIPALAAVVTEANRGRAEKIRCCWWWTVCTAWVAPTKPSPTSALTSSAPAPQVDVRAARHRHRVGQGRRWAKLRPTIPSFSDMDVFVGWMKGDTTPRPTTAYIMTPADSMPTSTSGR